METAHDLKRLVELVRQVEDGGPSHRHPGAPARQVSTGWSPVDAALGRDAGCSGVGGVGGLSCQGVHEWFSPAENGLTWSAPLAVLMHLAQRAGQLCAGGWAVWIGKACWPYAGRSGQAERDDLFERSLLIDPPDVACRLWAIDLAARCAGIAAVVADGRGLKMSATRRVQLAARGGALMMLARPEREVNELSAATTRWLVRPVVHAGEQPAWDVQLLRCKGGALPKQCIWRVEQDGAKGVVFVPAVVVDRPAASQADGAVAEQRSA
jgi:hypothetical protein